MPSHATSEGVIRPQPSAPFAQGRFVDLPEKPWRAHVYDQCEVMDVALSSGLFGAMQVHVRKYGQGPPLLLVHGLMTSSYSWRYSLAPLGKHFTCYAPDLPGAGRSDKPTHVAYSPANLAVWLDELQVALGIEGCAVLGNSMGGYIAMNWALEKPGAMSRLINLHSPGVPELRIHALGVALSIPGVKPMLRKVIQRDVLRWAHRNVHYYDETYKSLEEAHEYGDPLRSREGADALIKYLSETLHVGAMQRFQQRLLDNRRDGNAFPVPLLLMYAEQDPMVPPRFGQIFADRIPGASFVSLQEASHFAHVDAVDRFIPPVLAFLGVE